jgi:hypothetical protein
MQSSCLQLSARSNRTKTEENELTLVNNSMEKSYSSEDDDSRLASQEMFRLLWKPNIHDLVYKISPSDHILNQINPV